MTHTFLNSQPASLVPGSACIPAIWTRRLVLHRAFGGAPPPPNPDPTACRAARDDPIEEEEEEYISNLCQCLCSCLMRPENKSKFLEVSSCGGAGVLRAS